jgi:integrase
MRDTGLDITPHILRHTVATQLAQKNVPIPQIARILGHSDSRITERVYAKFSPEFCRQAVTHLNV